MWCNGRVSVLAIARIAHSGWWDARGGRDGKHHPLRILSQFGKGSLGPWRKRISRWPTIAATVSISPVRAPGRPVIIIIVAFRLHRPSSGSLSYALAAEGTVLLVVLTAARKRPDLTASSPASTCLAPLLPAPTPWLFDLVDSFIVATPPFVSRKTLSTRRVNLGYRFLDASPTPPHLYTGSALGPRRELKSSSPRCSPPEHRRLRPTSLCTSPVPQIA